MCTTMTATASGRRPSASFPASGRIRQQQTQALQRQLDGRRRRRSGAAPLTARCVGGEVMPAKKVRGLRGLGRFGVDDVGVALSVKRERKPDPRLAVGSHVQHSSGLRGVVTSSDMLNVATKTELLGRVFTRIDENNASADEAALCDLSRLTPNEWLQAQIDGAVCAVYEGRARELLRDQDGRTQRMSTVESNGDVRCALCNWTAPGGGASRALQNDLSAWGVWSHPIKTTAASLRAH